MGILEIVLLAAGAIIFLISFCIPIKQEKLNEDAKNLAAKEIKELVSAELLNVRGTLTELSEEEMKQQIEKSARSMERISNEKIMAVSEYSDTVLEEIHKNHDEVVFLYDMLKNKKEGISETYDKMEQSGKELLQQVKDSEITIRESLEEISRKQKEIKAMQARAAMPAVPKQAEIKKEAAFQPMTVKKVEAALPEKQEVRRKPVPKQALEPVPESAPKAVPERKIIRKVVSQKPAEPVLPVENLIEESAPAENEDVMLLLSNQMQSKETNSNERILGLHRAGKSNMAIARELGLGIGEVKLVIDLYKGSW